MQESLFEIEALIKRLHALAQANPLYVSASDTTKLFEIMIRVQNKVDRSLTATPNRLA